MADDIIGYRQLAQEALRDVVRQALKIAAGEGLPGAHHFYLTFDTRLPGVDIDADLRRQFPEQMTIVLEHQFWDLDVDQEGFEVTLKFSGIPKYLRVPFSALIGFHDPSVDFVLRFEPAGESGEPPRLEPGEEDGEDDDAPPSSGTVVSLDAFRKKSD